MFPSVPPPTSIVLPLMATLRGEARNATTAASLDREPAGVRTLPEPGLPTLGSHDV
jgi:hypothetical protein